MTTQEIAEVTSKKVTPRILALLKMYEIPENFWPSVLIGIAAAPVVEEFCTIGDFEVAVNLARDYIKRELP